ncbi:MAG: hypothetical protein LUD68_10375 [Rikenellaceae bacterium]|nr:hypothetical protein [Rikenellaceae bacterium]
MGIGLPRSENLYQIKKGNHGISKQLAETIISKYPDICKPWLLTGEGEMLRNQNLEEIQKTVALPYLDNE